LHNFSRAVDATTPLLRKDGYAVFTTGFNEPDEIESDEIQGVRPPFALPLVLGVTQTGLDGLLQANGLALQEGPRKYTIEGRSPFHYFEVFAYKKG